MMQPTTPRGTVAWLLTLGMGFLLLTSLTGCQGVSVYQRSVADLNTKAQAYLQQGDSAKAICRLEAALELMPDEPNTLYNLAVAYRDNQRFEEAIQSFSSLLELKKSDPKQKVALTRSLGIVHEERADQLMADVDALEQGLPPVSSGKADCLPATKPSAKDLAEMGGQAILHYQAAIDFYQQAIDAKAEDAEGLTKQIKSLQEAIDKIQAGKPRS